MQVANKKSVNSETKIKKAKKASVKRIDNKSFKINNTKEYKNTAKSCKYFLRQLTVFNGLVTKVSKAKLGDKKLMLNTHSSLNKVLKLWNDYEKMCMKLHIVENNTKKPMTNQPIQKKNTVKVNAANKKLTKSHKKNAPKTKAVTKVKAKVAPKKANIVKIAKKAPSSL